MIAREGSLRGGGNHGKEKRPRRRLSFAVIGAALAAVLLAGGASWAWAANIALDYSWYTANPGASTFTVSSAGQLMALSNLVGGLADTNGDGHPEAAVDFRGKTVKLGGNLIMAGADFYPIGTKTHPFDGTFDGNGKTISYLKLTQGNDYNDPYSYVGLFGYAGEHSLLKNITLEDSCEVAIAATNTAKTVKYVGALVGYSKGDIEGCTSRAQMNVSWDDGNKGDLRSADNIIVIDSVGGIAGVCDGDLKNDSFSGSLKITTPCNSYYDKVSASNKAQIVTFVGGVAGRSGGATETAGQGTHGDIAGCSNLGQIVILTTGTGGVDRFGEAVDAQAAYVGGITGYAIGNISSCANSGEILTASRIPSSAPSLEYAFYGSAEMLGYSGADGGANTTGGIVGSFRGNAIPSSTGISAGMNSSDPGTRGKDAIGTPDKITLSDCKNTGFISALNNVGGICGLSGTYTTVTRCVNGDAVLSARSEKCGYVRSTRWNKPCTGGITGQCYGVVSYSRNHGEIGTTTGGYYSGGIAGYTTYYVDGNGVLRAFKPEVYACYNTGQVHSNILNNSDSLNREGSLVGGNNGFVHDCLFLYGTVNKSTEPSECAIGASYEDAGAIVRCQVAYTSTGVATAHGSPNGIVLGSKAAVAALNALCPTDGWDHYYVTNSTVNKSYPVMNSEAPADSNLSLNALNPTISLVSDASYTAAHSPTPKLSVSVTVDGKTVTLVENADYTVVADPDALGTDGICKGVTNGTRPYTAGIKGVGGYYGELSDVVSYGITKGDFSECSVSVATTKFTGQAQNNPQVTVVDSSGAIIDPANYTYVVNNGQDCIAPSWNSPPSYLVVVNAKETSNYTGHITGAYTIEKIDIARDCDVIGLIYDKRVWYYDDEKAKIYEVNPVLNTSGNLTYDSSGFVIVEGATTYTTDNGRILSKATPKSTDSDGSPVYGMNLPYTGAPINPTVIGVAWKGQPLVRIPEGQAPLDTPDAIHYRIVYGGVADGNLSGYGNVQNIEAVNGGFVTVGYTGRYTSNYVVMPFAIDRISVQPSQITVSQSSHSVIYAGGAEPGAPSIFLLYHGVVIDPCNYTLTPAYSEDANGTKHYGSNITYNIGDEIYYTVSFVPDGSIICDPIPDAVHFTVIDGQTSINESYIRVEVSPATVSQSLWGLAESQVTITNTKTGKVLVEGEDYTLYHSSSSWTSPYFVPDETLKAAGRFDGFHRAQARICGINAYAGIRVEYYTVVKGTISASNFDPASGDYNSTVGIVNGSSYTTNTEGIGYGYSGYVPSTVPRYLAWRVNGYSAEDISNILMLAWQPSKSDGIVDRGLTHGEFPFVITKIVNPNGEVVPRVTSLGTYTFTLAANPSYPGYLMDLDPAFSMQVAFTVQPLDLTNVSSYHAHGQADYCIYYQVQPYTRKLVSSQYAYTGNPVLPDYVIYDTAGDLLKDYYEPVVVGYGTTGPVQPGAYAASAIQAVEGCPYIFGSMDISYWTSMSTFSIVPADISDPSKVSVSVAQATYTGHPVTPAVSFSVGGKPCNYVEGTDYRLSWSNNVNVASATSENPPTVTITVLNPTHLTSNATDANGNYTFNVPFDIVPAPVSLSEMSWSWSNPLALKDGASDGSLVVPKITGTYVSAGAGGATLTVPSAAYTVETGTYAGGVFTPKTAGFTAGNSVYYRLTSIDPAFPGTTVVGPATVTAASAANSFSMLGQSGSDLTVTLSQTSASYTSRQITPSVIVKNGSVTLKEGTDYTVSYDENVNVASGGSVTVVGMGAYTGTAIKTFAITPVSMSACAISVTPQAYTGSQVKPGASDVSVKLNGVVLPAADWGIDASGYGANVAVGVSSGTMKIAAGSSGNLSGSTTTSFTILPVSFTSSTIGITASSKTYTGSPVTLGTGDITVTNLATGSTLTRGVDYTVGYSGNHTSTGAATIWVSGMGSFIGTLSSTFTILPADISGVTVTLPKDTYTFTGAALKPEPTATFGGVSLLKGSDYTATYSANTNVGIATVILTGMGNWTGSVSKTFTIAPADLSTIATISLDKTSWEYTGSPVKPVPTVKLGSVTLPSSEYTVTYQNNGTVGMGTVTVTGIGTNVTGSISTTFSIVEASLANATIADIPNQLYAWGTAITPALSVKSADGVALVAGTDYTAAWSNNTSIGTASVTITGKGNYTGSASKTFHIIAIPIAQSDVTFTNGSTFAWTGSVIRPTLSITVGGRTLIEGTDYALSFLGDQTSAGTQVIEITTPAGSAYSSAVSVSYTITMPTSLDSATIDAIPDQTYTGAAITPAVTVRLGGVALVKDTDYTVTYSNNVNVGTASVTVTGKGAYTGTKGTTFKIVASTPASSPMPVYRFYNVKNGSHFYTASAAERDIVISRWPNIYTFEGAAYSVNTANPANSSPLYRFYNVKNGSHFYTVSAGERDIVKSKWPNVYSFEGPVYNVCATPVTGATPVYRFYNKKNGSHFYTVSEQERDIVISRWPDVYTFEGPAFWLAP